MTTKKGRKRVVKNLKKAVKTRKKKSSTGVKKVRKPATKGEALNSCGRLKKGFVFKKGGAVFKVVQVK